MHTFRLTNISSAKQRISAAISCIVAPPFTVLALQTARRRYDADDKKKQSHMVMKSDQLSFHKDIKLQPLSTDVPARNLNICSHNQKFSIRNTGRKQKGCAKYVLIVLLSNDNTIYLPLYEVIVRYSITLTKEYVINRV